jgi:hypothetical protein
MLMEHVGEHLMLIFYVRGIVLWLDPADAIENPVTAQACLNSNCTEQYTMEPSIWEVHHVGDVACGDLSYYEGRYEMPAITGFHLNAGPALFGVIVGEQSAISYDEATSTQAPAEQPTAPPV